MKKIFLATAIAFAALSLQSCLHDDEELFPDSAANRLEAAVKADRELLESAENGWEMHYYTGEQYTGGGYTMFMKFKNGKAFVSSDIAPADMVETSSYDIVKDKGPVLTFNTYNMVMHYLAQPFQDDVDGEQGDYEFVITKTTQDSIYVKGKKWGNKFVMTPRQHLMERDHHQDADGAPLHALLLPHQRSAGCQHGPHLRPHASPCLPRL